MRGLRFHGWMPVLLLIFAQPADAGSLRVGPTIVTLDAKHPVATLRVTNNNPSTTAIEVRALAWRQDDNQDIYEPSDQLIVTPPIFELAPGDTQIIRAGLRDRASAGAAQERAFRVFIAELPAQTTQGGSRIQTLMRVGVPIFVRAGAQVGESALEWRLHRQDEDHWSVLVSNTGSAHAHIIRALLEQDDAPVTPELSGLYVLAGSKRLWSVAASLKSPETIRLQVMTRDGTRYVTLNPSE
jgi:fimbrial chaperone protein